MTLRRYLDITTPTIITEIIFIINYGKVYRTEI